MGDVQFEWVATRFMTHEYIHGCHSVMLWFPYTTKERKWSHPFLNYLYRAALSTLRSCVYLADPDIFTHRLIWPAWATLLIQTEAQNPEPWLRSCIFFIARQPWRIRLKIVDPFYVALNRCKEGRLEGITAATSEFIHHLLLSRLDSIKNMNGPDSGHLFS